MPSNTYKDNAPQYRKVGISALPIREGTKRPAISRWQEYCTVLPDDQTFEQWLQDYSQCNIGLALGMVGKKGYQLIAIDVDSNDLVEPVMRALGGSPPGKRGAKGITYFCLADKTMTNRKFKRFEDGKPSRKPSVEILCKGSQTVIPPSVHPDTNEPYEWTGRPLFNGGFKDMPTIGESEIDEITAICHGKADKILPLNDMTWKGVDKGGDTHDTCVVATAALVARGWTDTDIHGRIERAKREACERAGDVYDWPDSSRVIQGWIDSAREKGMTDNASGAKKLPPERLMALWLIDAYGGAENVVTAKGLLRYYKDGYWPQVDVPMGLRSIYEANETIREREAKAAVSIAHTLTNVPDFGITPGVEPKEDPKRQRICLLNGTINLKTGELEKWDPEHQLSHQLPFEWDDKATCPLFEKILEETFNGDKEAIDFWDEFCALSLIDDMSFQRLLFLKGPGGNGKGTLSRVLRAMHDPSAVGSVGITDLNDERKRTSLVGKLINISGEQSRLNLVSDTYLKKITGGDPIDVRKLYGETKNNVILSVRFLELVNEMPATSDSSHALKRRIVILMCPNKVMNPDYDLDKKLLAERPGILRRWATCLNRLYERGDFKIPERSTQEVDQYMLENDPVSYWVVERCEKAETKQSCTASRDLYGDFRDWCDLMGYGKPMPEVVWGRRLTGMGYPSEPMRIAGDNPIRVRKLKIRKGG